MIDMKSTMFAHWGFMRILRVAMGLALVAQAWQLGETLLLLAGTLLVAMAVMNVGCCGSGDCAVPQNSHKTKQDENVAYEEIH